MNPREMAQRIETLETKLETTGRALAELVAIRAIEHLKYRYFRAMDTADMALLRSLLVPDFNFRFEGSAFDASGSSADDFISMMTLNFNSDMATQHHGHHPEIALSADGRTGAGVWYLQDIVHDVATNVFVFGTNFYRDAYVLTDDGWKIAASRWERHIEVRQQLAFTPNYADRFLAKHGSQIRG